MNISNISKMSDISFRVPRGNSTRLNDLTDQSMIGRTTQTSNYPHQTSSSVPLIKANAKDTVILKLGTCHENIAECTKAELMLDCFREVASNEDQTLDATVADKLQKFLLQFDMKKYMRLAVQKPDDDLTILGIIDLPEVELTYSEKMEVKGRVYTKIRDKIHDYLSRYELAGGKIGEVMAQDKTFAQDLLSFGPSSIANLSWKREIEEVDDEYRQTCVRSVELLDQWRELKDGDLIQAQADLIKGMLQNAQILELKAKIARLNCTKKMYTEQESTLKAFKLMNSALDEKIAQITNEIKRKKSLKKEYEELKNTEFSEILNEYNQLCTVINKRKKILQMD